MKIESSTSSHLLHKGSVDSAMKMMKEQGSERMKDALNPKPDTTKGFENKGFNLDVKG
jgi:hypothetical protein